MSLTLYVLGYTVCAVIHLCVVLGIYKFADDDKTTKDDLKNAFWAYFVFWPLGLLYIIAVLITHVWSIMTKDVTSRFLEYMNKGK